MAGIIGEGNSIQCNNMDVTGVKNFATNIIQNITQMISEQQTIFSKESIWFDVRDPVRSFTGRSDELKDLHNKLQSGSGQVVVSQIASISGLGGIGKSELARKYAHEYKKDYGGNLIWVNSETKESFRKSFQELAKELRIAITEKRDEKEKERDIKSIVKDVYKYFENAKSLLIFDNVEEYKDIKEFLPESCCLSKIKKPYILITSRNQKWERSIEVLSLGTFTEEEAIQFIMNNLSIENSLQNRDVKNLAEKLQYFPLALQQAVAYINTEDEILKNVNSESQFKISDYLEEFEKKAELLDFSFSEYSNDSYTRTTLTTWQTTLDKIKDNKAYGQQALEILNIIAYFAPDNTPTKIFLQLVNGNERELGHALQLTKQYSMVRLEQGILNIHRLVQRVIRLGLQYQSKEQQILSKALQLINSIDAEDNSSHVMSIWDYASKYEKLIDDYYFNSTYGFEENTPLHLLAQNDGYKTIEAILTHIEKSHSNKLTEIVNATNNLKRTPLHFAAERGNFDIVKYLMEEKGADFNAPDELDMTPLSWASLDGNWDVVKYLIEEKGADCKASDNFGYTPLHWAAEDGSLDVVKYLIEEKGADFTATDYVGETPLHWAARIGNLDVAKYLIEEKGADFNTPNDEGKTPLHQAAECGRVDLVKYLIEEKGVDALVGNNHCEALRSYIEETMTNPRKKLKKIE